MDVDAARLKEDWSAFFLLFSNDKGIKLRLNIPDTVVLELGQPVAWFYTSKEGYVQRQPPGRTTLPEVRQQFLRYAAEASDSYSARHVAVMRLADGTPKLLGHPEFEALCDSLEAQLASGKCGGETPRVLQAYVPPFLDLRYITSYTNDGVDVACQTFQRRFSRRYVPYRATAPTLLAGTLSSGAADLATLLDSPTASPGGGPAPEGGIPATTAAAEPSLSSPQPLAGSPGAATVPGAPVAAVGEEEVGEVQLDDRTLADMERSLGRTLGPVDPSLKMQMRKAAHGVVQYVQKARGLTLRGLVCEFVRDTAGEVLLMGPLRADWASLIPGRGGEPWANANLVQPVREEPSGEGEAQVYSVEEPGAGVAACSHGQFAGTEAGLTIIDEMTTSVTVVGPLGQRQTRTMSQRHVQHTPSLSGDSASRAVTITDLAVQPQADSPRIAALRPPAGSSSPAAAAEGKAESPGNHLMSHTGSPLQSALVKAPFAASKSPNNRSPGAAHSSRTLPPASLYGEWHHSNDGRRGPSLLTSQLTKELVTLQDELTMKTELAEALAAKVETLEHDKHVITEAFERVVSEMQGDLQDVRGRLNALRVERDSLSAQLAEAQARMAKAEAERDECRARLEGERGTTMASLGEFQRKGEEAAVRAAQAVADLRALQEKFREEQVAYDALKKQMVFYQHTLSAAGLKRSGDSFKEPQLSMRGERPELAANPALALLRGQNNPEMKFWETLSAVEDLLNREADPDGERYALAKVLHTCQGDLHAIFLYYCMLDSTFTRHWPPQLAMSGWMAFVKDSQITNLVPGTRTRTDTTIPVADAQEMFRRYCVRQAITSGTPTLTHVASARGRDPNRPPSANSTASMLATGRPTTSAAPPGQASTLTFQGFCAVLVNVAARLARTSPETVVDNPFLSEQTRAFIEDVSPKAQRVTTLAGQNKRTPGGGSGAGGASASAAKQDKKAPPAVPAAREAAAQKLPKLKKGGGKPAQQGKGQRAGAAGAELRAIAEASREGSAVVSNSSASLAMG